MKILSSLYLVRTQDTLFSDVEFQRRYRKNPFTLGDLYLTSLSPRVQYLSVQHIGLPHFHKFEMINPPSSNCTNVIISPVVSFEDLAQGMYNTAGRIAIAYALGCDVHANVLEKLSSKTTSYEDIIFLVFGTYARYPFF